MKATDDSKGVPKSILQTAGKSNNASKGRRISWGGVNVKEFDVHRDEYNNRDALQRKQDFPVTELNSSMIHEPVEALYSNDEAILDDSIFSRNPARCMINYDKF
jgi:hypothetical protein